MTSKNKKVLVIGGGISGITAALEIAEVGYEVALVEKAAYLGGRVVQMNKYFPKMCPPTCGMEINNKRIRNNPRITVYTLSEVTGISGAEGDFNVSIKKNPRYVKENAYISDETIGKLSCECDNNFNLGMNKSAALYYPHPMAYPPQYVINKDGLTAADQEILSSECPEGAIDLNEAPEEISLKVGAIVVATGWTPYDAAKIENLGFGKCRNVITNVMMERLASKTGPTEGQLLRPSDGVQAKRFAFAQCAGSRDENHLPYCSAVCCMGSLKQIRYVLDSDPEATATIFYIDIRTISRCEKFYYDLLDNERVTFIKGKAALITEDAESMNPVLEVEDSVSGQKMKESFDMVVLATGMVPNTSAEKIPLAGISYDDYGFIKSDNGVKGIYSAGCVERPIDVAMSVRKATGAALKAIQSLQV